MAGCFFSLRCSLFGNLLFLFLKIKEFVLQAPGIMLSNFSVSNIILGEGISVSQWDFNSRELSS